MTDIITITEDKGVTKKILEIGTGPQPIKEDRVCLHYEAYIDNAVSKFDSSYDRNTYFEFILGGGKVIDGWEKAIKTMNVGETAEITCSSKYAYGKKGYSTIIPPDTNLKFKITLLSTKETLDSISYRIKKANGLKVIGNDQFKKGDLEKALQIYKQGSKMVINSDSDDLEEMEQLNQTSISLFLNMGLCHLKLKHPTKVIECCEKVINLDKYNTKAYYRLGQAYSEINDYEKAILSVKLGLEYHPNENSLLSLYKQLEHKQFVWKKKNQEKYKNIFCS